jgi:hypothetical protein
VQAHRIQLLGHGRFLADVIRAAVQLVEIRGDEQAFGVVPGALTDSVAGIHGRLPALS